MADNINFREYGGAIRPVRYIDVGSGIMVPAHVLYDSAGAELKGEKTAASSLPVVLPSNMPLLGRGIIKIEDSFNRPADTTAYTSGDLVANSTTAGSVTVLSWVVTRYAAGACEIIGGRLSKTGTNVTNASFKVHLYASAPTVTNGDNGAWLSTGAGASPIYIGHLETTTVRAFSDGAAARLELPTTTSSQMRVKLASGSSIKGLLEVTGAYTPASAETFVVTLEVLNT